MTTCTLFYQATFFTTCEMNGIYNDVSSSLLEHTHMMKHVPWGRGIIWILVLNFSLADRITQQIEQRAARERPCRTLFVRNVQVSIVWCWGSIQKADSLKSMMLDKAMSGRCFHAMARLRTFSISLNNVAWFLLHLYVFIKKMKTNQLMYPVL